MTCPAPGEGAADPAAAFSELGAAAIDEILPEHGVTGDYACIIHGAWRKAPTLGALACAAVGIPELVLFHDHILMKHPNRDDMAWHQDF